MPKKKMGSGSYQLIETDRLSIGERFVLLKIAAIGCPWPANSKRLIHEGCLATGPAVRRGNPLTGGIFYYTIVWEVDKKVVKYNNTDIRVLLSSLRNTKRIAIS